MTRGGPKRAGVLVAGAAVTPQDAETLTGTGAFSLVGGVVPGQPGVELG